MAEVKKKMVKMSENSVNYYNDLNSKIFTYLQSSFTKPLHSGFDVIMFQRNKKIWTVKTAVRL